ncbi:response regulator [Thalassotalea piscium]|uniref:histidine kinase n=1 Tax=Thalassotalea piscium TaxID=1230533 RepID=A0A7X0NJ67_9GAMM|nr:response regulator [Thalassotalea piscium]MBB6544373.1 signal transduction histidine kinase/BarA-like signal transduction histidine kinase [Thalassotalea piscium]
MSKLSTRILLVEDDEDDYILTCDYLQQMPSHHFTIDWVDNPVEALALLKANTHDICLLDYQLGGLNGLAVLKQTSADGCTVPIIMLTGQTDTELDNSALDAGAVDYLVKSELNSARFNRAIRYALARKDIENERVERIKAEAKSRSKDKFLAHLSHELRTPLTSILGYTELLLSDHANNAIQPELTTILDNGKHLLGLLNNVLDLSKIAAGKFELNNTTVSFESFIVDVYTLMSMSAQDKGINLNLIAKTKLPIEITADPLRLRQVLINIIHNAIKFTNHGSVDLHIWLEDNANKPCLCFSISDTGVGIPDSLLATIFKPFEQVQDIVSRNEEGAGLGLSICSELLKHMGGNISVESTLGVGSKFVVSIDPGNISGVEQKTLSFKRSDYKSSTETLSKLSGKVLIVDDIDDIRRLIGYVCRSFGLEVSYANNGQQAISKIVSASESCAPYDLVLMDIHMPVLDGKRAISQLRNMHINTPILAITAATMKGVQRELHDLGFNDVVPKPIDKYELHQKIMQQLIKSPLDSTVQHKNNTKKNIKNNERILLIEDDVDAAEITALLLQSLDKAVTIAHSATAANNILITDKHWQYILVDMNLPDANGLILSSSLKQQVPNANITIVSGNQVSKESIAQSGADKALLKPINLALLQQLFDQQ